MRIYVDSENKCHVSDDGTFIPVEVEFFDGKCQTFIEGYCCEVRENCTAIYPWKPFSELDSAQRAYEKQLLADYESALAEIEAALGV